MREFIKALCLFLVLSACENINDKMVYKPQSSGNINDLSVVIDNELWESPVGESIRSTIGAPLYGLPQDEPQFKLRQIPLSVFSGFVKNTPSGSTIFKSEFPRWFPLFLLRMLENARKSSKHKYLSKITA